MTVILGHRPTPRVEPPAVPTSSPSERRSRSSGMVDLYAARTAGRAACRWSPAEGVDRSRVPSRVVLPGEPVALGRGTVAHREAVRRERRRQRAGAAGLGRLPWLELLGFLGPWTGIRRKLVTAGLAAIIVIAATIGSGLAQNRYVVKPGDTIDSIAETFGVDPQAIVAASWVPDPSNLQAGHVIIIPQPGQSPSEAAQMAAERQGTSPWVETAYVVQPGDTLAGIGARFGLAPGAIAGFNNLGDAGYIEPGQRLLIPHSRDGAAGATGQPAAAASGSFVPGVGTYVQQRNLSCEYAAAYIATSAFGAGIPESVFMQNVPQSRNPHWGYRGNIDGWWGNTDDYGVYPAALVPTLNAHGFVGDVFYSFGDASGLKWHIDMGRPVLVWLGFWGDTRVRLADEGTYSVAAGMHAVVVYGYDDGGVHVSDPATGTYDYYGWSEFIGMWTVLDGMSMAVYPA